MSRVVKNRGYLCRQNIQGSIYGVFSDELKKKFIDSIMVAYETFMNFLKEKGCQDIFNEAFQTQAPGYSLDAKLWDILGGDEYIFGRIFDWEKTLQGRQFWAQIDLEWYNYSTK